MRKLIAKWRESNTEDAYTLTVCADELEAALSQEPLNADRELKLCNHIDALTERIAELEAALPQWHTGEPPEHLKEVLIHDPEAEERSVTERCGGGWLGAYDDVVPWQDRWLWMEVPELPGTPIEVVKHTMMGDPETVVGVSVNPIDPIDPLDLVCANHEIISESFKVEDFDVSKKMVESNPHGQVWLYTVEWKVYIWGKGSAENVLVEKLAAHMHNVVWSGWVEYMLRTLEPVLGTERDGMLNAWDAVERWKRQMTTTYADLTEDEKESDRDIAREILRILEDKTDG